MLEIIVYMCNLFFSITVSNNWRQEPGEGFHGAVIHRMWPGRRESQPWWLVPIVPALGRLKQKDHESLRLAQHSKFKVSLLSTKTLFQQKTKKNSPGWWYNPVTLAGGRQVGGPAVQDCLQIWDHFGQHEILPHNTTIIKTDRKGMGQDISFKDTKWSAFCNQTPPLVSHLPIMPLNYHQMTYLLLASESLGSNHFHKVLETNNPFFNVLGILDAMHTENTFVFFLFVFFLKEPYYNSTSRWVCRAL